VLGPSTASQSPPFKRTHTRSRSNAAAIDLLAVTGSLSPCGSSIPQAELHRSLSGAGSLQHAGSGIPAAAGGAAVSSGSLGGGLMSKQQQQQLATSGSGATAAAAAGAAGGGSAGAGAAPVPESAAALLPGLHLGPPGTNPTPCSSSNGAGISRTASGARKLARQGSSAKGRKSANSQGGAAAGQAQGGFFLSCDGSSSPSAAPPAAAPGSPSASTNGATAPSCTPLLSGCCAPSFAVGLLIALLYKGRFPEEYEAQWAGCPRLKVGLLFQRTASAYMPVCLLWG
jgi:hypothetical protein